MMRQMRENTKWIMVVVAVAFVGLMVFQWGMDLSGRSAGVASSVLGKVNGEEVTSEEYNAAYRNLLDQQQRQMGAQRISAAMDRQIQDAAWNQVVTNKLLSQELKRRGIEVTDAEIKQAALYAPPQEFQSNEIFQTNGAFDPAKYQQYMSSPAIDDAVLLQLEAYYRDVIPRSKLFFQSTAGLYVSDGQLWRMYLDGNEKVSARFVVIDPKMVVPANQVTISDAQIRDYYNEHKAEYPRRATSSVKYAVLDRTPTAADSAAARAGAANARQQIAGGKAFDAVASELGIDTTRGTQRTEVIVSRNGQFPPAFEQAAFSLPVGQLSDVIATQYGFHVMRVQSRTDSSATVHQVMVPMELSDASETALLDRADSLEALGESMKLDAAAKQLGLVSGTTTLNPPIAFIPGVGVPEDGIDWVFNDGVVGDVSPVFESPTAYYMLELTARTDSGTMTLEEAKPAIRETLLSREQVRIAKEKVTAAIPNKDLDAIAAMYRTQVGEAKSFARGDEVPGLGRINEPIGAVFGLATGQRSDVITGGGRLFIVQNTGREGADRAAFEAQKAQQRTNVLSAMSEQKWQQYLEALRKSAKIVDNRREFERAVAAQNALAQNQ